MHLAMQCVEVLTRDRMAEITLNRPKVNAMNQALLREMTDVFERLAQDDAVSGVLVRGTGHSFRLFRRRGRLRCGPTGRPPPPHRPRSPASHKTHQTSPQIATVAIRWW
ncbi:enoyl-CoA hydratase-related protein [Sorangium sp. So ce367]|uniref:enoyl-CoA hydratase/isomerase family protein n=1 Tax=Sorangium sp. So ce367 TaxID=3133305 RepID=UPI003F61C172